jgi:hypothetical protein
MGAPVSGLADQQQLAAMLGLSDLPEEAIVKIIR